MHRPSTTTHPDCKRAQEVRLYDMLEVEIFLRSIASITVSGVTKIKARSSGFNLVTDSHVIFSDGRCVWGSPARSCEERKKQ